MQFKDLRKIVITARNVYDLKPDNKKPITHPAPNKFFQLQRVIRRELYEEAYQYLIGKVLATDITHSHEPIKLKTIQIHLRTDTTNVNDSLIDEITVPANLADEQIETEAREIMLGHIDWWWEEKH